MSIFRKTIPVWVATLVLVLVAAACIAAFIFIKEIVYNNSITLSSDGITGSASGTTPFVYGSWPALDDADFYTKTLNSLVAQKTTFIEANLSTMTLRLYENGAVAKEVPILSKGRSGSWWETPAGLYKVLAKTPSDYSRMAGVYSPWALDFQGNFLIHGWPHYPDGTPVGSTYSGGCIRLSTDDAKALYPMVPVGTPVLVSSANFTLDNFHEAVAQAPISATSYFAGDLKSDFVFAEKNPDEQVPIASITKLMTALVAVEYVNIENKITITPDMIVKTSVPRLKVGQSYSLYDLLQPLLKESSNESAVAIANFLGPKYFVQLMNNQAASIGMTNTHFVDSSGMDWGDVSTAHDLFILAQYLYNNRSFILMMTTNNSTPNAYGPSAFTNLQNFNVFADNPDFVGGKVGLNGGASGTIMSVFKEPFNEAGDVSTTAPATTTRPIMLVILGSSDYEKDAQSFLSWIKGNYQ
jgi:D-alanyl-D-alanine carboxypeptidase